MNEEMDRYALSKQIDALHTLAGSYGELPPLEPDELDRVKKLLKAIFTKRVARHQAR